MAFSTLGLLAFWGAINSWHIYFVCLLDGTLFVFFNIAEAAALSSVVPRSLLPQASSTNEAGFGTATTFGPVIATLLYQMGGIGGALWMGATCYLASFLLLKFLRTELNLARTAVRETLYKDISEGVRWLAAARLVLLLASVMGALNLLNAAMPLLAITLGQSLGASDTSIGTMVACGGIGSILGSLCGPLWLRVAGFGRGVVLATWAHAAAFATLMFVQSLPMLGIAYGFIVAFYSLYAVMQFAYRAKSVPEHLQGRVNSACRLIAFSLYPPGSALAGIVSQYWGVMTSLSFFTAVAVVLAGVLSVSRHVSPAWTEGCVRPAKA